MAYSDDPQHDTSPSEARSPQAQLHPEHQTHHATYNNYPLPEDLGHSLGETEEQHAAHANAVAPPHFGLSDYHERVLFYTWVYPSWALEIVAAVTSGVQGTRHLSFIITVALFLTCSWAAWIQTAVGMTQRASWVREESNLPDRRRYLYFAVRLNRLMMPTAVIAFVTFIVAYARRYDTGDICAWLLFLLIFIINTVGCVMNAYNNITWESDRLAFEDGETPYGNTLLSVLGLPNKPRKEWEGDSMREPESKGSRR